MIDKIKYNTALLTLGFEKTVCARGAGSHMNYIHNTYSDLTVCIVDHKGTKEMSSVVHKTLINTMTLVCILMFRDNVCGGVKLRNEELKRVLKNIDPEISKKILAKITQQQKKDNTSLYVLLDNKIKTNMETAGFDQSNDEVILYLSRNLLNVNQV